VLPSVPAWEGDERVDYIATEKGLFEVGARLRRLD
jgi:hypothetical protein